MTRETSALFLACQDDRTRWDTKLAAAVVVAYAFSPISMIPAFIPVPGRRDDLMLVPPGVVLDRWVVLVVVLADCRSRVDAAFVNEKPVFWTAAVVIIVLWRDGC